MDNNLALKLVMTPLLVGGASLASRRWGPNVGGWLIALPLTSGPIIFFLVLSQGTAFAAATAVSVLAGALSPTVFSLTYAWLAVRAGWRWPPTLAVAILVFAASTLVLRALPLWWPLVYPVVIVVLVLALRLMPRPAPRKELAAPSPSWDVPARIVVATTFVVLLTAGAPLLGPQLTGLLAPFPLFGGTLAVFTHHFQGPQPAVGVLRGLLHGLFAFASFFVVLTALLTRTDLVTAFGAAIAVALLVQSASLYLMRRAPIEG